jgi:hypothetical protein
MFQVLLQRVINISIKPLDEWKKIGNETWTVQDLYLKYALILGAIGSVAGFVGFAVIGTSVPFVGTIRWPIGNAITMMVLSYVLSMGLVFGVAFIMDALAPSFGAEKDLNTSLKIVIFSWTAAWVGGIFQIIPPLGILGMLCGIYSLVLMYFGMKELRGVPADKLVGYYVVTLVIALLAFVIVSVIVGLIAAPSMSGSSAAGGFVKRLESLQ